MANCTFVAQDSTYSNIYQPIGWYQETNSYGRVGSQGVSMYHTTMITFRTPSICISNNVTFNLGIAIISGAPSSLSFRYAISSSDANKNSYCNTYSEVSEDNQITSGTTSVSGLTTTTTYHDISINTTGLKGDTTYYLFLWAAVDGNVGSFMTIQRPSDVNHTISITDSHDYASVVTPPTCTAKGYTTVTCRICGHSYTTNEKAALGHVEVYGGTSGVHTKCSRCGSILSTKHTYTSSVQTDATCTTKGTTKYTCACGYHYTSQDIPAKGHSYKGAVVAPTCTTQGYTKYKCTVCGDTSKANDKYTAALGHDYKSAVTKEPTYTSDGVLTYTCSRSGCGDSYTEVIPKKLGGFFYIDNGSGWDAYMVYIDNGSEWDLYLPYIDNGSEWIILA